MSGPPRVTTLARIWPLLRLEWKAVAGGTALLLVGSVAALVYPQGIRVIVDGAVAARDPAQVRTAALLMAALAVLQGLAVAGRAWLFAVAGERGVKRVREALFRSLVTQEVAFFDAQRTGDLTSRLGSDTASLQGLLSSQLSMALRNGVQVVGGLVLLVITSPKLTGVMLLVVPAVAIGAVVYGRRIRSLAKRYQDALADAGHVAEESLSAIAPCAPSLPRRPRRPATARRWTTPTSWPAPASAPRPCSWAPPRPASTRPSRWCSATAASSSPPGS
jgi:ATP-binding cassette subfamily B protein